jgi:Immunoglobulin-like domain of bacterial spore germination
VRKGLLTVLAALAAAAVLPAPAAAALTATDIRIGMHPAFVRVVVDFTGGNLELNRTFATDPNPFGGRSLVEVSKLGIDTDAAPDSAFGVEARISQHAGRIVLHLHSERRQFKYLSYDDRRSPTRLVVDLWKAKPPSADAEFPTAPQRAPLRGCLEIETFSVDPGSTTAEGKERRLFEHSFTLALRNRRGERVRRVPVTSSGGNWNETFSYSVGERQPGTLEAVSFSAKDGAVDCIAQVRATLKPA